VKRESSIFVAGHKGLAGSAIVRKLVSDGFSNMLNRDRAQVDLRVQSQVDSFFEKSRPEYVFLAAAKVGGIHANSTYPADFIRENLQIQTNIIDAAYRFGAKKLLFLGSSCIYPKLCPQPIKEEYLLTGALEPTNDAYAIAKIAGIRMCSAYRQQFGFNAISLMPTNLYGQGDNFDRVNSHVLPALIRRFHEAKMESTEVVTVWGSGNPKREFLHVDDLADAAVYLMQNYDEDGIVNVGVGDDISIKELAQLITEIVGYKGRLEFDPSKPDGTPQKLLDVSKLNQLGWSSSISLREGLTSTYEWFCSHYKEINQTGRA
jgi:GDP-L-fucose synthase